MPRQAAAATREMNRHITEAVSDIMTGTPKSIDWIIGDLHRVGITLDQAGKSLGTAWAQRWETQPFNPQMFLKGIIRLGTDGQPAVEHLPRIPKPFMTDEGRRRNLLTMEALLAAGTPAQVGEQFLPTAAAVGHVYNDHHQWIIMSAEHIGDVLRERSATWSSSDQADIMNTLRTSVSDASSANEGRSFVARTALAVAGDPSPVARDLVHTWSRGQQPELHGHAVHVDDLFLPAIHTRMTTRFLSWIQHQADHQRAHVVQADDVVLHRLAEMAITGSASWDPPHRLAPEVAILAGHLMGQVAAS